MSPHDLVIVTLMTVAAMTFMAFWRKVLMLLLSVAIAVFLYGLMNLAQLIHT
jgi:Ca2+/Na+ antiporter